MAYLFLQLLINLILFWHNIDGTVLNCTVYPVILQLVPNQIVGTIAVANSSNEEIFWTHIDFTQNVQFPLKFIVVIPNEKFIYDKYILQLHIYKLPRNMYDLPLWSADTVQELTRSDEANSIIFRAYSDYKSLSPCLMGIIINTQRDFYNLQNAQLTIKIGSMSSIILNIDIYMAYFPVVFMITDLPISQIQNSTQVITQISSPLSIIGYEARGKILFISDSECAMIILRASQEKSMNLIVIMSAHVFTSVSLLSLAATYRVYDGDYLLYEQSIVIDTQEFPFTIPKQLIPITRSGEYVIEATIFGPVPGFPSGITLFQGAKTHRLVPGIDNTIQISMLYTGPKIGTTIIGTIYQTPPNSNTWPLAGLNLAILVDNQAIGLSQSIQFIIYDQTFPIEFSMLNIQKITASYQNIVFTVTITYLDGTVIWEAINSYNKIIFDQLNKFDVHVLIADGYRCQTQGGGYCTSSSINNINQTCCSQFKCTSGQCKLP